MIRKITVNILEWNTYIEIKVIIKAATKVIEVHFLSGEDIFLSCLIGPTRKSVLILK